MLFEEIKLNDREKKLLTERKKVEKACKAAIQGANRAYTSFSSEYENYANAEANMQMSYGITINIMSSAAYWNSYYAPVIVSAGNNIIRRFMQNGDLELFSKDLFEIDAPKNIFTTEHFDEVKKAYANQLEEFYFPRAEEIEYTNILLEINKEKPNEKLILKKCEALVAKHSDYIKAIWLTGRVHEYYKNYDQAKKFYLLTIEKASNSAEANWAVEGSQRIHQIDQDLAFTKIAEKAIQYAINFDNKSENKLNVADYALLVATIKTALLEQEVFAKKIEERQIDNFATIIGYRLKDGNFFDNFSFIGNGESSIRSESKDALKNFIPNAINRAQEIINTIPSAPLGTVQASAPTETFKKTFTKFFAPSAPPLEAEGKKTFYKTYRTYDFNKTSTQVREAAAIEVEQKLNQAQAIIERSAQVKEREAAKLGLEQRINQAQAIIERTALVKAREEFVVLQETVQQAIATGTWYKSTVEELCNPKSSSVNGEPSIVYPEFANSVFELPTVGIVSNLQPELGNTPVAVSPEAQAPTKTQKSAAELMQILKDFKVLDMEPEATEKSEDSPQTARIALRG